MEGHIIKNQATVSHGKGHCCRIVLGWACWEVVCGVCVCIVVVLLCRVLGNSRFSRRATTRGSCTGLVTVGPNNCIELTKMCF